MVDITGGKDDKVLYPIYHFLEWKMDSTSHLCAKAMLENLLENLFGKYYDMVIS
jgi:hypothetical protein